MWLIERANLPVGYMVMVFTFSLGCHGRNAFVDALDIVDELRGLGVGKQAIAFAIYSAHELGLHTLHLEVEHGNIAVQKLYRKYGFKDHDGLLWTLPLEPEE